MPVAHPLLPRLLLGRLHRGLPLRERLLSHAVQLLLFLRLPCLQRGHKPAVRVRLPLLPLLPWPPRLPPPYSQLFALPFRPGFSPLVLPLLLNFARLFRELPGPLLLLPPRQLALHHLWAHLLAHALVRHANQALFARHFVGPDPLAPAVQHALARADLPALVHLPLLLFLLRGPPTP